MPILIVQARKLLIAFLFLYLTSTSVVAEDRWIELRTTHFLAVSNASEGKSRVFLRKLEQFHLMVSELFGLESVSETPLVVVIFKDERSFNPYKFFRDGKRVDVGGYFQRGRDRDMIAANIGSTSDPSDLIFHEYVHRLTAYHKHPWPVWLGEGIAEYYSTYQLSGNKATIGAPIEPHIFRLRERRLMPLEILIQVDHHSPEYNERDKRGIFYSQSWALVHYLMMAEKTAYRSQLIRYTELLSDGGDPEESFRAAFNFSFDELERRLKRYVEQDRYFGEVYQLEQGRQEVEVAVERLEEDRWKVHLGDLLAQVRRVDDARTLYQEAVVAGDRTGQARERLSQLEEEPPGRTVTTRLVEDVEPGTERRVDSPEEPEVPGFAEAKTMFDAIGDELGGGDQAQIERAFQQIESVIAAREDYAPARHLFAELALLVEDRLEEAVVQAEKAIALDPDEDRYRITLAQIHMFSDRFEEARKAIEPVLQSRSGIRADYAARMLENIAIMLDYERGQRGDIDRPGSDRENSPDTPYPPPDDADNCRPSFVDVSGMEHVDVQLEEIRCGEGGMFFLVRLDGESLQFTNPEPAQPVVFSCSVQLTNLKCGPFEAPTRIYFDAGEDPARGPVRARAVEIRRQ